MKPAALILLVLVVLVLAATGETAQNLESSPTWLSSVMMSDGSQYGSFPGEVALDDSGDAVAGWLHRGSSGEGSVEVSVRRTGGEWQQTVSWPGWWPSVAIDAAGDAFVAWAEPTPDWNRSVVNARVLSSKGTWGPITQLSTSDDQWVNLASVHIGADAQGNALVIWGSYDGFRSAYRPANAARWLPPVTIDRFASDVSFEVSSSGKAIAAWSAYDGEQSTIRVVLGESGRWQTPGTLAMARTTSNSIGNVSASVNAAGAALVAWADVEHGNGIVSAAYRDARDSSWSVERDLSFADGQASKPATGLDRRGDAFVVWYATVDVEGTFRSAEGTWELPTVVGAEPGLPLLAVGENGDAVAAWTTGATATIKSASRSQTEPLWKPLGEVSPASQGLIDIELNSTGDGLATWAGRQPAFSTWAAGMDAAGPAFRKVQVRSSGYAGQRLLFGANAVDTWSSTLQLAWDFGDGSRARGASVAHTYDAPGTYNVSVTASDSLHHASRASRPIVVKRAVPLHNERRPSIVGSVHIGAPVACQPGRWSGTHPIRFAYRWLRNGRVRPGPARQRITLRADDARSLISCGVVAANYAGSARATSPASRVPAK